MTVAELIEALEAMPQDAVVYTTVPYGQSLEAPRPRLVWDHIFVKVDGKTQMISAEGEPGHSRIVDLSPDC